MSGPAPENFENIRATRIGSAVVILLCVMLVLSVIAYGAVDSLATALLALGCTLIVWLWLAEAWRLKAFTIRTDPMQLAICGLILIGGIQLLPLRNADLSGLSVSAVQTLSLDPYATRFAVIKLFIYLIFFAAALTFISTSKRFRRVTVTIIFFGAVIATFAILQKLINPDNIYGAREAVQASTFGPYVNGHHFAALMEMIMGLTLGLLYGKTVRKELRIIFAVAAVLMGAALIMTGSRGGLLSFLAMLSFVLAFTVLRRDHKAPAPEGQRSAGRRNFALIGGGLTLVLLIVGIGFFLGDDSTFRSVGLQNPAVDASNGRLHFWFVALQIFRDNFLLGVGLDAFGAAFTKYDTWNGAFRIEWAHNDYLQMLADAGIFGFICIAGFIYFLFKRALRSIDSAADRFHRSAAIGALAGCFGVLIHSFFDFPLRTPANALMFLTLAAIAAGAAQTGRSSHHH